MINRPWSVHQPHTAYFVLLLVATAMIAILIPLSSAYFQRFFGHANPVLIVLTTAALGGITLHSLRGRATLKGIAVSTGLATLPAVAIIIADFFIRYPEDTNVPPPQALLFYPAVGFVGEIVFHVLSLALVMLALAPFKRRFGSVIMQF